MFTPPQSACGCGWREVDCDLGCTHQKEWRLADQTLRTEQGKPWTPQRPLPVVHPCLPLDQYRLLACLPRPSIFQWRVSSYVHTRTTSGHLLFSSNVSNETCLHIHSPTSKMVTVPPCVAGDLVWPVQGPHCKSSVVWEVLDAKPLKLGRGAEATGPACSHPVKLFLATPSTFSSRWWVGGAAHPSLLPLPPCPLPPLLLLRPPRRCPRQFWCT